MKRNQILFLVLGIIALATELGAQTDSAKTAILDTLQFKVPVQPLHRVDTLKYLPPSDLQKLPPIDDSLTSESQLTQNPTTALFRSMFVPGWGQIVNKAYLKAGLYGGLQIYFASRAIHHAREASEKRKAWESATVVAEKNAIYDEYLISSDARNAHRWYFGITTMISMFDAYVDAHLSGRPRVRREKLLLSSRAISLDVHATTGTPGLQLALRF